MFETLNPLFLQDAKTGSLDKWVKNEGDAVAAKEVLCEVTLNGVTIGLSIEQNGILAKKIVNDGQYCDVGTDIALIADGKEAYLNYLEALRIAASDREHLHDVEEARESGANKQTSTVVILREVKHLIQKGILNEGYKTCNILL